MFWLLIMGRTARKRRSRNQEVTKDFSINNEELYRKLKAWMLSHKWKAICNLKPYVFEATGRGLMTLDKVKKNQVVLQVPKSLLITSFVVSQNPIQILFSQNKSYSAQCVIAAFLIYEKHLGDSSFWKPYLDTLPNLYTNPGYCTKSEKKLLPLCIINELDTMSKKLNSSYISIIESIKALHNENCEHCNQSFYNIFSYQKFTWAYYTVNTRAIYINDKNQKCSSINIIGDDNMAMAPLLDLFNHSCETVAEAQLATFTNNEFYLIKSLKSYEPKMQVFINYGSHSNLKLYLEYGFFIPENPLDQIFFSLCDVQKCHQVSTSAYNFLKMSGYNKNMAFTNEGLNYNAKNALFIITADALKETSWKNKIYQGEFDKKDLQVMSQLGLTILQNIRIEITSSLENMTSVIYRSESFSIAISLIKDYVEIIEKSIRYMKLFTYD